jgi:hypothetical protein
MSERHWVLCPHCDCEFIAEDHPLPDEPTPDATPEEVRLWARKALMEALK